jgi:polysaccharide export outer membrane protein
MMLGLLVLMMAACTTPPTGSVDNTDTFRANPLGPATWKPDVFGGEPVDTASLRILKRGDKVVVNFSGVPPQYLNERLEYAALISERGRITLPFIKDLEIAGLTPTKAARKIEAAYISGGFFKSISCTVLPQDPVFFVRGEVRAPGGRVINGNVKLSQAITMAGDFTDFAGNDIVITRVINGDTKKFDYNWKKIQTGKQDDPEIYPDDVIYVKKAGFLQFTPPE